jgi:hypothetical protein
MRHAYCNFYEVRRDYCRPGNYARATNLLVLTETRFVLTRRVVGMGRLTAAHDCTGMIWPNPNTRLRRDRPTNGSWLMCRRPHPSVCLVWLPVVFSLADAEVREWIWKFRACSSRVK